MLEAGQTQPWQKTLKEMTGEDHLDAQPMLDYFAPLHAWLKVQNATAKYQPRTKIKTIFRVFDRESQATIDDPK
jgi:hypothetical protein